MTTCKATASPALLAQFVALVAASQLLQHPATDSIAPSAWTMLYMSCLQLPSAALLHSTPAVLQPLRQTRPSAVWQGHLARRTVYVHL